MQRNWIGRSEGAHVDFEIEADHYDGDPIRVFTTRPDTLFGATFMVVAADAKLAAEICAPERRQALEDYLVEVRKATDIDRLATDRPKTGVDLGVTAVNPVTGDRIPVWASDYVLADYGTGAIMAVPGQDQRDWEFADEVRPADRPHRAAHRGLRGVRRRGVHRRRRRRSTPPTTRSRWTAWDRRGQGRAIIDWLEEQGHRHAAS